MTHSVTLKDFQSFDEVGAGVHDVARINILVGANNTGKSKILRAIDRTIRDYKQSLIAESGSGYTVEIAKDLTESDLRRAFPQGLNYATFGDAWHAFGAHLSGSRAVYSFHAQQGIAAKEVRTPFSPRFERWNRELVLRTIETAIKQTISQDAFEKFSEPVYYIAAERDVKRESENTSDKVSPNGDGVTNLFRLILTKAGVSKEPIERWLLHDLNRLLAPDHHFSRVQVLQHDNKEWEIFLEEKGKGLVPLSQCGSGLRTLIHIVAYTNLVARRTDNKITSGTFLFEELENCLHPHVQRNLFAYLDDVVALPARVFLTTHSSVCLDFFQGQKDVVLTHVYQKDGKTRSRAIEAYADKCGVLDCIGSKASDALQSNAVVWVEGPSDRIYLKKWLELCGSDLREGRDFSIMFYGGDILTHLAMNADEEVGEYVRLLRINRNSAIIIDSDKRRPNEQLKDVKQRVKDEAEAEERYVWITKGKEVENYIDRTFLETHFVDAPQVGQFDPPWKVLAGIHPRDSSRGLHTKVEFAEFVVSNADSDTFALDWKDKTQRLIAFLKRANLRP